MNFIANNIKRVRLPIITEIADLLYFMVLLVCSQYTMNFRVLRRE